MKKLFTIKNIIILFVLIFLGLLVSFARVMPSMGVEINGNNIKSINYLKISDDIFYRQTLNNCAPYAVMGVVNILKARKKIRNNWRKK
jgi:hypothetical protein